MTMKKFLEEIEKTYSKYFPNSKCFVKLSKNLYHSISINCFLANDRIELSGGYWENDMFSITFWIDTEKGQFDKNIILDSEVPNNLKLECTNKSYLIKPNTKYMAYGRTKLTFRKTVGNDEKILKSLDKFFKKLYDSLLEDIENNNIHEKHIELLKRKLEI